MHGKHGQRTSQEGERKTIDTDGPPPSAVVASKPGLKSGKRTVDSVSAKKAASKPMHGTHGQRTVQEGESKSIIVNGPPPSVEVARKPGFKPGKRMKAFASGADSASKPSSTTGQRTVTIDESKPIGLDGHRLSSVVARKPGFKSGKRIPLQDARKPDSANIGRRIRPGFGASQGASRAFKPSTSAGLASLPSATTPDASKPINVKDGRRVRFSDVIEALDGEVGASEAGKQIYASMCVARQFAGPHRAGAAKQRERGQKQKQDSRRTASTTTTTTDATTTTLNGSSTSGSRRVTLNGPEPRQKSRRLVAGVMPLDWYATPANTSKLVAPPNARDCPISVKQEVCADTSSDEDSPQNLRSRHSRMKGGESPEPLPDGEPDVQHFHRGRVTYDSRVAHNLASRQAPGFLDQDPAGASARIAAAKPLQWRGEGNLPQLPWQPPDANGHYLFIELWSGIGTAAMAMLAMGMHITAVAAEHDKDAVDAAHNVLPGMLHYRKVEGVRACHFAAALKRRNYRAIMIGGGSPCQANIALNKGRNGLKDPRSLQPTELMRLKAEFEELTEVPVLTWLENVASMPAATEAYYRELTGAQPLLIQAGKFGWVQRKRLFFCTGPRGSIADIEHSSVRLPPSIQLTQQTRHLELEYTGSKPLPSHVHIAGGYKLCIDPHKVVRDKGVGAIHPFVREFPHPEDRVREASAEAVTRFYADDKRFPPSAYEEPSMAWKGTQCRTFTPDERAQMHMLPPSAVIGAAVAENSRARKEQVRNSLIGNSLHVPSIMLAFIVLLQLLPPAQARPQMGFPFCPVEQCLRDRIRHTALEPGLAASVPGVLTAENIVEDMILQLPWLAEPGPRQPWRLVTHQLAKLPLHQLQLFYVDEWLGQRNEQEHGPDWLPQRTRAAQYAGFGTQRSAGDSRRGLDHLIDPGLGPDRHLAAAKQLENPFSHHLVTDSDTRFAARVNALLGVHAAPFRRSQILLLRKCSEALEPMNKALWQCRNTNSMKVAAKKRPDVFAFLTCILRWPDRHQARSFVEGFNIVGESLHSRVFRDIKPRGDDDLSNFYGESAERYVSEVCATPPPKNHEVIYSMTKDEVLKGYCSSPLTREELDAKYGRGNWRPLPRFLVDPETGKPRVIDDGSRGKHNTFFRTGETIFTISPDWVLEAAAISFEEFVWLTHGLRAVDLSAADAQGLMPEGWAPLLSTNDLVEAYRQCPVSDRDAKASIIALWAADTNEWKFCEMYGLAFGFSASVLAFNRGPTLMVAAARRIAGILSAAYFDDLPVLDTVECAPSAHEGLQDTLTIAGYEQSPAKAMPPSPYRVLLGTSLSLARTSEEGIVLLEPTASTHLRVMDAIQLALDTGILTPAQASKLRGQLGWAATATFGRLGRIGTHQLKLQQYGSSSEICKALRRALKFLLRIHANRIPREVQIYGRSKQPLIMYSDASYEPETPWIPPRLGWIIFDPESSTFVAATHLLRQCVVETWLPRKQQIFAAESMAVLAAVWQDRSLLEGRDIVWFIDNEAAASSMIRGGSAEGDVNDIAEATHVLLHRLGCRMWVEWIDSGSNPSDGASREGVTCPWCAANEITVRVAQEPPWSSTTTTVEMILAAGD